MLQIFNRILKIFYTLSFFTKKLNLLYMILNQLISSNSVTNMSFFAFSVNIFKFFVRIVKYSCIYS
jgi:hypothetical protein